MRKTLILLAVTALALPAVASAHGGRGHHRAVLAKLSGTATSFGNASATATGTLSRSDLLAGGTFSATVNTNWAAATTKTFEHGTLSCAPATASLSVVGASSTNAVTSALTGKTCAWTKEDGATVRAFFGRGEADGAGTLAALDGKREKAWLMQKSDGSVKGAVFAGRRHGMKLARFAASAHRAAHETGDCDRKRDD
jgi:hypothetical protein